MIQERKRPPLLPLMGGRYRHEFESLLQDFHAQETFENMARFSAVMQVYEGALREVSTKLENMDDEFQYRDLPNPIHHMESRLKSLESILGKLQRRGLPLDLDSVLNHLTDIAGIRVMCNYVDDVYEVCDLLARQPDVTIVRIKDYIKQPKPNGYRSLHIICTVPVYLSDGTHITPVEVQLRTIAMDYWASLEHQLRYKNELPDDDLAAHSATLLECAQELSRVEDKMQAIHREIARHAAATSATAPDRSEEQSV